MLLVNSYWKIHSFKRVNEIDVTTTWGKNERWRLLTSSHSFSWHFSFGCLPLVGAFWLGSVNHQFGMLGRYKWNDLAVRSVVITLHPLTNCIRGLSEWIQAVAATAVGFIEVCRHRRRPWIAVHPCRSRVPAGMADAFTLKRRRWLRH